MIALDKIPYEGLELKEKVKGYEDELLQIGPEKSQKLIEKGQDY